MPDLDTSHFAIMRTALAKWVALSDAHWEEWTAPFHPADYDQGEHLVTPGTPMQKLFFVVQGLLRFYYIDAEGRSWNKSFVQGGTFAGAFSSYALGLPAPYAIEALEPTRVLTARWTDIEGLYDRAPAFERLGRRFAEWLVVQKELRERAFLELDATARYETFLNEHPDLAERLPNYHVASYLGVTEVTLSRIRSRLARSSDR